MIQKIFFGAFVLLLFSCSNKADGTGCTDMGGQWNQEFEECTKISEDECERIGGNYDGCASPCRHTDAESCFAKCDSVCYLG
jgi:hypothetical protein